MSSDTIIIIIIIIISIIIVIFLISAGFQRVDGCVEHVLRDHHRPPLLLRSALHQEGTGGKCVQNIIVKDHEKHFGHQYYVTLPPNDLHFRVSFL